MGCTPTEERAPASELVGLLTLYSNRADQGKRFRKLLELPERAGGELARTPSSVRQRPTKAQREAMIAAYHAGQTIRQVAEELGFNRETVSIALEREGVARRYHLRREVDLALADELHASGLSIIEVAKALGIGRTTLIKARRARC